MNVDAWLTMVLNITIKKLKCKLKAASIFTVDIGKLGDEEALC